MSQLDNLQKLSILISVITGLSFAFETHMYRRDLIFNQIAKTVKTINGDVYTDNVDGLVYFKTNYTRFNLVSDNDFKVSEYCGELYRNVQYCQWQEVQHSHTIRHGNDTETYYTYTYHKGWYSTPISSLFFHNHIYVNPYVDIVPEVANRKPIQAGAYMLDNTIGLHGRRERLAPHSQQILQFENSQMARTFEYAGRGIFYRSYESGVLGKLLKIATFFDTENADRLDWCTPGDTRVWFNYWAPPRVTVVGEKNGNTITSKEVKGYKIGAAHSSNKSVKDIVKANASWFPTIMKWVTRVALVGIAFHQYSRKWGSFGMTLAMEVLLFCFSHSEKYCNMIETWYINLGASLIAGLLLFFINVNSGEEGYRGYGSY